MMEKDFAAVVGWNEGKSADFLLQWAGPVYEYPLTISQMLKHRESGKAIRIYKIIDLESGRMVGTIELNQKEKGSARIGRFLIGEEEYRGKGLGEKALCEAVHIGFGDPGVQELTLGVFDFNAGAVKCYERAGFSIVAHKKDYRQSSQGYWGLYEMHITREEWMKKVGAGYEAML